MIRYKVGLEVVVVVVLELGGGELRGDLGIEVFCGRIKVEKGIYI